MKIIYIAGPYSAPSQAQIDLNVMAAAHVANKVWKAGHVAICPHLNTYGFEGDASLGLGGKELWRNLFKMFLVGDFEIISRSDGVIMLPGWETSKGACAEYVFASWLGLPVMFWSEE